MFTETIHINAHCCGICFQSKPKLREIKENIDCSILSSLMRKRYSEKGDILTALNYLFLDVLQFVIQNNKLCTTRANFKLYLKRQFPYLPCK